ncbi:MAG TPA: hypothetical protein VNM40_04305 [Candidatus Paceibacterota bacterium]|nr:hypothetical protein [Candidatus Paceibacterota bacterium]
MQKLVQLSIFEKAKSLPQRSIVVAAYRGENHLLSFLYFAFGLCIAAYIYFVGLSIMNLIANREAIVESDRLQSEVASLEEEYFELAKGITPSVASAHGLSKPVQTSFVRRPTGFASNSSRDDL